MAGRYNPNFRLSCPSPYVLDPSLGTCVEPTPTGFVYQNGRFLRQCLPGMTLNEFGTCIRPVMTRKSFVNEASIQKTVVALGANQPGGSHGVILGTYNADARDMEFTTSVGTRGTISQVKLVDGSQSLFLAATDNRGSPYGSGNTQSTANGSVFLGSETVSVYFDPATQSYYNSSNVMYSNPNDSDGIEPDDAVTRMEYANIAPGGKMFMIGQPRNKIFVADFSASLYDTNNSGVGLQFNFDEPAYSLQGDTDPYYVGSSNALALNVSAFIVNNNGDIETNGAGIIQSSLDSSLPSSTPFFQGTTAAASAASAASAAAFAAPARSPNGLVGDMPDLTTDTQSSPSVPVPSQQNLPYNPLEPVNPWPQTMRSVSDVSSRGFTNRVDSRGYVFAGINTIPLSSSIGIATSVRYLLNDPGPLTPPPNGPFLPNTRALTNINLQLGPNNGDIRVARFDVSNSDTVGTSDTLYVFGTDDSNTGSAGPVLSFISENHVYGSIQDGMLPVYLVIGAPSLTNINVQVLQIMYNNTSLTIMLESLAASITEAIADSGLVGFTVKLGASFALTGIFQLDIVGPNSGLDFSIGVPSSTPGATPSAPPRLGPYTSSSTVPLQPENESGAFFGFTPGTLYRVTQTTQDAMVPTPNLPQPSSQNNYALYNGLSWDDPVPTVPETSSDPPADTRPLANAMPVGGPNGALQGQGLTAWSFNPVAQGLAFATGTAPTNGLANVNERYTRSAPIVFTEGLTQWRVPPNCVDIQVFMWGAGGSSDPNSTGTGGAGAYIQGHLQSWKPGNTLQMLVGSGGSGNTYGSGGIGSRSGIGRGGGRSAIVLNNYDLVTAGAGGGSVGRGTGGAASGTLLAAENGSSADGTSNGGLGASGSTGGRGGKIFGDPQFKYAPDGSRYTGGSSTSTLTKKASGGGGGGSGYAGGGSGGYLGYTGDLHDVATGGGGGSSYTANFLDPFGVSGLGNVAPYTNSKYYVPGVAQGGRPGNAQGGPGLIVLIATLAGTTNLLQDAPINETVTLWASRPGSFTSMIGSTVWGSVDANGAPTTQANGTIGADWSSMFIRLLVPTNLPGSTDSTQNQSIDAMYYGNDGLIVAVVHSDSGTVYMPAVGQAAAISYVWWAIISANSPSVVTMTNTSTDAFGPLQYTGGIQEPLKNVRAIRPVDPHGSNEFVFVGDGIRIVSAPTNSSGIWSSSKLIVDESGVPLDATMSLVDAQMNENLNSLEIVGVPNTLNVSSLAKSPWAPQFASFYESTDVPKETIPYIEWPQTTKSNPGIAAPGPNGPLQKYSPDTVPNTVVLINFGLENTTMNGWRALGFFKPSGDVSLSDLRKNLQDALQSYLYYLLKLPQYQSLKSSNPAADVPTASVIIGPDNVLAMTFTGLYGNSRPIFNLAFNTTSANLGPNQPGWTQLFADPDYETVDLALAACATLIGFDDTLVTSASTQTPGPNGTEYTASFQANRAIGLQSSAAKSSSSGPLTPLSVPLEVNSVFAGSIYHVYAPQVYLAVGSATINVSTGPLTSETKKQPIIVAVGGPFCSAVETIATGLSSGLNQPISSLGATQFVDFVNQNDASSTTGQSWNWALMDSNNQIVNELSFDSSVEPIRSPANILVSIDNGSSYTFTESFLASFTLAKGLKPTTMLATTALDSFHVRTISSSGPSSTEPSAGGKPTGIGPARMRDLYLDKTGNTGYLNAMVSQFNDVKFYTTASGGFFLAVGQFLWETNSIFSSLVTWPTSYQQLAGVAWVSLDGHVWTTLPMHLQTTASFTTPVEPELFWIVYKTSMMDPLNNVAALFTDLGMYSFNVAELGATITNIFTTLGPITDFTRNGTTYLALTGIARTGPYAAVCTDRDSTGTCIKCTGGAQPVSIAQVIGASGSIQPNLDTCMVRPLGPQDDPKAGYTSIEAMVDADAIGSYAGFDQVGTGKRPSKYVQSLRQSFYAQNISGNSLIVCPKYTDVFSTPAAAQGADSFVADQLQCALDPAFADPMSKKINVSGGVVVRRPALNAAAPVPDVSYDGTAYQQNYATQYRNVTLVAYDSASALVPDVCPSTLGIGGSTNVAPSLASKVDAYGFADPAVLARVTNYGIGGASGPTGPYEENESLGPQGANWNPNSAVQNRAVLANEGDTLDKFGYAQLNNLDYNPKSLPPDNNGNPYQSPNEYLYRLASFQFPYDAQTTDLNENGQPLEPILTIGRDPQVFEPGFGPLKYYAEPNVGFACSQYNTPSTPWPAWPVPQEGFGYWYIRPYQNSSTNLGLMQTGLGYGTILLAPSVTQYGQQTQGTLFAYDTTIAAASSASKYLDISNTNWTSYLPYSTSANAQTSSQTSPVSSQSPALTARVNACLWSMQNMLALRLANNPSTVFASTRDNWKNLVSMNFFRPRNWAFLGLLLDSNGLPVGSYNNNGVPQQVLVSDQPNSQGLYEFLVPDPYYAAQPLGPDIIGYRDITFNPDGSKGPDYERISTAFNKPLLKSLTIMEGPPAVMQSIVQMHRAFHYWTYNSAAQNATLDLFLNASSFQPTLDWSTMNLPDTAFDINQLATILVDLQQQGTTTQQQIITNINAAIVEYALNPLKAFVWSDPSAQTTRSLMSFMQEGIQIIQQQVEIVYVYALTDSGYAKRLAGQKPSSLTDFDASGNTSLIHHRYTVSVPRRSQGLASLQPLFQSNLNAFSLFGYDDQTPGPKPAGFVPTHDPRGYGPSDNFTSQSTVINVVTSDYDVETSNAPLFASGGPQLLQDLLAQNGTGSVRSQYGDPVYGFGLRIDSNAVIGKARMSSGPPGSTGSAPDLPVDHGYVSMVRTIVDGQQRFTRPTTGTSIDPTPHIARLTYITKYVPSNLKAYGAIVPFAPMRFLASNGTSVIGSATTGTPQRILNPFRPSKVFFANNINLVTWNRPAPQVDIWASANAIWKAFSSNDLDLEAPGFWGRMPLVLQNGVSNQYFTKTSTTLQPTAAIYLQDATVPLAGYDGLLQGPAYSSPVPTLTTTNTRALQVDPNDPAAYSAYLRTAPATTAIAGQMLVNISDLVDPSLANEVVRLEITLVNSTTYNSEQFVPQPFIGRFQLTLAQFMTTYINSACSTLGLPAPTVNVPVLCTHSEITQVVSTAIQIWIRSQTTTWASAASFTFSGVYDRVTDRPSFTFTAPGYGINIFRLVLPSPLSNWLGLRPVAPPMYDITDSLNSTSIYNIYNITNERGFNNSGYNFALYSTLLPKLQLSPPQDSSGKYIGPSFVSLSEFMSAFAMGVVDLYNSPSFVLQFMVLVGYFSLGSSVAYIFTSVDTSAPSCFVDTALQGTIDNWTQIQGAGVTQTHLHFDFGSTKPYWTDKSINAVNNLKIGTNTSYVCQPTPFSGTGWANSQYWTSTGWTSSATTPLYNLYYESSSRPYDANFQPPHETDAYIPPQKMISTITFTGRSGFDDTGLLMTEDFTMCDITNVSWTTRLASTPARPYFWGLVGPQGLNVGSQFSAYHAAAELSSYSNPVTPIQVQSSPTAPLFMQYTSDGASTTSQLAQSTYLSNNSFLDFAGLAALEVPCGYGSEDRPVNYDQSATTVSSVAALAITAPTSNNWSFSTRQTYNALQLLQASNGSNQNPFRLQNSLTTMVPAAQSNKWPANSAPPVPASAAGLQPVANSTTDASGTTVFLVNQPCYFNVGSLTASTRSNTNDYSVYAFNWTELFATSNIQPWTSGIDVGQLDLTKFQRTYLDCEPLYMDENYDAAPYSRLGRSLKLDATSMSSSVIPEKLVFGSYPIVLIVCPGAASTTSFGSPTSTLTTLPRTFSNGLVYSFTEKYSLPQSYGYAFTSIPDGPIWTFYGLDNQNDITVAGSLAFGPTKQDNALRKTYKDFDGSDSNSVLGLDVRQVYPSQSLCVGPEFSTAWPAVPSTTGKPNYLTSFGFHSATYEQPDWSQTVLKTAPFLPLGGTWTSDDLMSTEESGVQAIANYEGLSVNAEWRVSTVPAASNTVGSTLFNQANGMPNYIQFAVDRNARGPLSQASGKNYDNPFDLGVYEFYRPSTVFVLICDIWRNSLRAPQELSSASTIQTQFSADPTMLIDYVDCMGPEDYDTDNVNRSKYFSMCQLQSTALMGPKGSPGVLPWAVTPWVSANTSSTTSTMVWSPFTGGSFWNTFETFNTSATPESSLAGFSPSLWWPTYRWSLGDTDPNNVWPTSVATNDSLLKANYVMFTCTDGTIRKMLLTYKGSTEYGQFPAIDSTGLETFYNAGINGAGADGQSVYSYTFPGRLYNLTYWANHWWCTADNSAVWTTAPLNDPNQTLINDPIVVEQFICSIIKFRPLGISEGSPWSNTTWPSTEPHKYNVMKILPYQNQSCLFVGSVDGFFIVITQTGTRYQSILPKNAPVAWPFLPGPFNQTLLAAPMLYVTDIATDGQSILVGSMPLPIDPNTNSDVPWYFNVAPSGPSGPSGASGLRGPIQLPLLSLGHTAPSLNSINDLINSCHDVWPAALTDANTVAIVTNLKFSGINVGPVDLESQLAEFSNAITTNSIGSVGSYTTMTVTTNSAGITTIAITDPSVLPSGLSRLLGNPDDGLSLWPNEFAYKNPDPTNKLQDISEDSFGVNYGLQNSAVGNTQPVGYSGLIFQTHPQLVSGPVFESMITSKPVQVPTFYLGGLDMDALTRAFFVVDNPVTNLKLGPKPLSPLVATSLDIFPANNAQTTWLTNIVPGAVQTVPMWANSVGIRAKLVSSDGITLDSSYVRPLRGPLTANQNQFSMTDYSQLNLYLSSLITRSSPLVANDVVSDMAYGPQAGTLAWTTFSPYGSQPVEMSLINVTLSVLPTESNTDSNYASVQPQFTGPSVIAWSPYEMKFYVAGNGTNVPDWGNELLRPFGISTAKWDNATYVPVTPQTSYNATNNRLILATSDCSQGSTYVSLNDSQTYAVPYTQVYQVAQNTSASAPEVALSLVSQNFTSISCFGFSPMATAVGGSFADGTSTNGVPTSKAIIYWRTNTVPSGDDLKANWSLLDLGVAGSVTAMKYVGYAWYIATWDPYANFDTKLQQYSGQSTVFFTSINFNAASVLDTWNASQNAQSRVASIDAVVPSSATCSTGFEPDPNNPTMCVKVCPVGFKPFGSLCVQNCPSPYTETGIANECVPDSQNARFVAATASGKAIITPVFQEGPKTGIQPRGVNIANVMVILFMIILFGLLMVGIIRAFRH